jgi:hypothetical protein
MILRHFLYVLSEPILLSIQIQTIPAQEIKLHWLLFIRDKNPVLRRTIGRVATLPQAASVGNVSVTKFWK